MKLYNSLTRKVEEVKPINEGKVGIYTCGPTVYDYASIGNFRTYTTADILVRTLKYLGYEVDYIMNLTDVGHLTGDNEGDADIGEDRMEKGAKREGKTAWDVANFYSEAFFEDFITLNLTKPKVFAKATEHIKEQVSLVKEIEEKGFTYKTSDGIYFDTEKFEKETGKVYGEISDLDEIKEGARVEPNLEKKNPRDFALWKFSKVPGERHMEWESPWGLGFPGWHIECSAMSMKYLGETFDIHIGGEDLKQTHHPNEIAQSEAATGKPFVNYWVHGAFLKVDGKRMGKSLGNAFSIGQIAEKGYDPLALRYFYMSGNYRTVLNFTWQALDSAENALKRLRNFVIEHKSEKSQKRTELSPEKLDKVNKFRKEFENYISDDLKLPQALAVVWEVVKSNIPDYDKLELILSFDEVLGLNLKNYEEKANPEIEKLLFERESLRQEGKYSEADAIRERLKEEFGWQVRDNKN